MIFFNCQNGWHLARSSQYRWYQVIYQLGVFISRSSVNVIQIKTAFLPLLAILQVVIVSFFKYNSEFTVFILIVRPVVLLETVVVSFDHCVAMFLNFFFLVRTKSLRNRRVYHSLTGVELRQEIGSGQNFEKCSNSKTRSYY